MWFFNQKRRVREVVLKIMEGLRDGTLVLDPPLVADPPMQRDEGEALPQESEQETCVSIFSTSSLGQGVYGSFIPGPPTPWSNSDKPRKRVRRGALASTGYMVVTGGNRQEIIRDALVQ